MKISDIQNIGTEILELLEKYNNPPKNELSIDLMLFAYLSGRFAKVDRQHHIYLYGSTKPNRIDFRLGSSNPVVLELAVRPPKGGSQLSGSQNTSELRKLCRVQHSEARLRVLFLLDLCHTPLTRELLKATYDIVHAGRGKFKRSPVRVIYVHVEQTYHFRWSPFKS